MIKLTRDQAEHDRRERPLMDVEELAEQIFWIAADASGYQPRPGGWRCGEQNYLRRALTRTDAPLQDCEALSNGPGDAAATMGAARRAQLEAEAALRTLRQQRPGGPEAAGR